MRGRNVGGASLVAHGRVNEWRGGRENGSETKGARRAALLLRVGLRLVVLAVAGGRLHLRAAISLGNFEARHLAGQRREGDGRTNRQANESAQDRSHGIILGLTAPAASARQRKSNPVRCRKK